MKIAIVFPNLLGSPQTLDLGIAYLATYIRERTNHEVRIVDTTFHSRDWRAHVRREIEAFCPDVIGFSVFSVLSECAAKIATDIRTYYRCPHIVGGYQAILAPEETISWSWVDALCTGEGEFTLTEYLDALSERRAPGNVAGLWYKEGGRVHRNPLRPVIADLDSLPFPDWDLFPDVERYLFYLGRLFVLGTRGCPYRCSFCGEAPLEEVFQGKRWRERSPDKYVEEIAFQFSKYRARGMVGVHLFDTVFTFHDSWLDRWLKAYRERGLHRELPFSVFVRPDVRNISEDKVRRLAETGCAQVRMGIESGTDSVRHQDLGKSGCTNSFIVQVLEWLNQYGILAKTYSIIGFPSDTRQTIASTIRLAAHPLIQTQFVLSFTPIQGSAMAAQVREGMNSTGATRHSFHFSGGGRNSNYPAWYVSAALLGCYFRFGARQAWLGLSVSPLKFIRLFTSRVLASLRSGNSLLMGVLCAVIHPALWSEWKIAQSRTWARYPRNSIASDTASPRLD